MDNRRRMAPLSVPLIVGILSLANVLSRPTLQNMRTVDIVQLLATGMCFGAALAGFGILMRSRNTN